MEGWISLYRKFTEWEWYTDANTMRLFLHLLLKANHQDGNWQGKTIRRGQVVIGRKSLANELKISEQAIRTSLNKLKITNEITIEATNKFSIITIEKYDVYQDNQKENNQQKDLQATNEQPTSNQQLTTNNNNNNNNNIIYFNLLNKYKSNDFPSGLSVIEKVRKDPEYLLLNNDDKISLEMELTL